MATCDEKGCVTVVSRSLLYPSGSRGAVLERSTLTSKWGGLCFCLGYSGSQTVKRIFSFCSEAVCVYKIFDLMVLERWVDANLPIDFHPSLAHPNDLYAEQ